MEELDGSISVACVKEWTICELLYVHTTFTRSWHALYDLASPCQIGLGTRRANTTIKPPEAFTVTSSNCGSKRVCCMPIRHYHGVRNLQSAVCGPPAHGCMPLNPNCDGSWILGLLLPLLLLPPPPPWPSHYSFFLNLRLFLGILLFIHIFDWHFYLQESLLIWLSARRKMFIGGLNWETTERKYRLKISAHNYLSLKLHKIYVYRLSYFGPYQSICKECCVAWGSKIYLIRPSCSIQTLTAQPLISLTTWDANNISF